MLVGLEYFHITRGEQILYSDLLNSPLVTLMFTAARAMAFVALLCSLLIVSRKITTPGLMILSISIVIAGIIMNPLAIPRSYLASYFLSILFVFRPLTRKLKLAILSVLIVGQVTVLPLLSELQRGSGQFDFWRAVNEVSQSADFDGFQSTINVVSYADTAGFKYGANMLSAALVFVPRSVWPSKSYAAGSEAAEAMGYAYTNVSSPLPSEFYLDFGYFGVVIGGFLVGWTFRYIDMIVAFRRSQKNRLLIVPSACFISFIFIVLRGSLIGTFGALFLTVIVAFLVTGYAGKIVSTRQAGSVP
jgi:oligosaccharide repeat unit polymerase